jgi:uncharacterized protein with von Willebrand factor type A (vWA) domain
VTSAEIVRFCRFARAHGFSAGVTETIAAIEAARAVDSRSEKLALRAALCASKQEWDEFGPLFEAFARPASVSTPRTKQAHPGGVWMLTGRSSDAASQSDRDIAGAGDHARLKKIDFSSVPPGDQRMLEQLADRLLRRMSWRLARRLRLSVRGRLDLRRTIRASIGRGGAPIDLRYKGRNREQARIVTLIDVSGSMSLYSLFFLRFTHALRRAFKRSDAFLFSTSLFDAGPMLRSRKLADALRLLAGCAVDWSGGTKIGESLRRLNHGYARLLSRDTLLIILSDGWDTGDPERMAAELAAIRKRVRRVIWLNPLLGLEDYRPATDAMARALPHLDVFAPAHSLESLLELEKYLSYV